MDERRDGWMGGICGSRVGFVDGWMKWKKTGMDGLRHRWVDKRHMQ